MQELRFTLLGSVPSKKNSRQLAYRNGRIINIPSKRYREWEEQATEQWQELDRQEPMDGVLELRLKFWVKDNRRTDLSNKQQSIEDWLQDIGLIKDDCWQVLRRTVSECVGIDKNNPRVEIVIKTIDES